MANNSPSMDTYMVEVIGHDGIAHHVGPFRTRAHAECWIAQNTRLPTNTMARPVDRVAEVATPKLALV
jgi:hypothetical protein